MAVTLIMQSTQTLGKADTELHPGNARVSACVTRDVEKNDIL